MPFDSKQTADPMVRRAMLIEALRQPDPYWNFSLFTTCACGLAKRIGIISNHTAWDKLGEKVGISNADARRIFNPYVTEESYGVSIAHVTSAMIADALERLG